MCIAKRIDYSILSISASYFISSLIRGFSWFNTSGEENSDEDFGPNPFFGFGIPTRNRDPQNYYKILGVETTATIAEIRKSYRKLALIYHPDKTNGKTEDQFKRITAAYTILSDETSKRNYDLGIL